MTFEELVVFAKQTIRDHPKLKTEVRDLVSLAQMEITLGESEEHECELAHGDIQSSIKNRG